MKHIAIVTVLTILATLGLGFLLQNMELLPQPASAEGQVVDAMFDLQFWIISFLFSLIVVFILYSVVVFRRKPGEEDQTGDYFTGHSGLEIVWTLAPLIVVLVIGSLGVRDLTDIISPADDELTVQVTGFQFGWRFDYPEEGVTSNALNVPLDRKVHLELNSLDVIHSFWVPEFRVKQDAVPGKTTHLRFTPNQLGTYTLRCAELCGLSHTYMLADVNVMEAADFEAWVAGEQQVVSGDDSSPVDFGVRVYQINCTSCHTVDGSTGIGPTFLGSFGAERTLESGETVVMDETYVHNSIVDPGSQIVQGYSNIMPLGYGDTLSPEEIDGLVAYIKSLSR